MLRSPLYFPNFRWLWLGQTLILSAAKFWMVSLTWLVLQKTASGLAVGTVLAGGFHFLNSSRRKSETFTIIRSFFR